MALLVQAEQQVSHWCVLAFHCTVLSISTAKCFSLQSLYLLACHIARLKAEVLAKFATSLLLMKLADHMAKTC